MNNTIPIAEIFGPTIQGEGYLIGQRTMFIRTGYCDGAGSNGWCTWCDSMFAVDPKYKKEWMDLTPKEIVDDLLSKSTFCRNVTISGGNPAMHDLEDLVARLHGHGYTVNIETQGTISKPWLASCDIVTVSPKPPSSGSDCNTGRLAKFISNLRPNLPSNIIVVIKVVVDPAFVGDYIFAKDILFTYDHEPHKYISVVTHPNDTREELLKRYHILADRVCADNSLADVAVLPQLHVLTYGHGKGV